MKTLIRCRVLWHLIWIYTVCHCPYYWTLGIHVFVFFFLSFGFYGPFKNIPLISSRSIIKGGRKPGNPGKKRAATHKQNLAFPHSPSEARTTAVRNLMDEESALLSTGLRGGGGGVRRGRINGLKLVELSH